MNALGRLPRTSAAGRLFWMSRPRFWLYLAGPVFVGLAYGASSIDALLAPRSLALFAYFLLPANVLLYGVNDLFDASIDRENPKKDGREVRYEGGAYTPAAVVASLLLAVPLAVLVSPAALAWILGFFVLAVAYSAPPARLKTRPPLDSLSNGLYILPGAAAYVAMAGTQPPLLALLGGVFWTMAMHTFSAVPDIEPDRRAGIATLATRLGHGGALAYCAGCWLVAAALFGALDLRAGALLLVYPALAGVVATTDVAVEHRG
mgnify:CR=1 FL=1